MITTHVLDTTTGQPAQGVLVRLESGGRIVGDGVTDDDGRCRELGPEQVEAGVYRLVFDTDTYFQRVGREAFFPEVTVTFRITDTGRHYHVPVLLSPFSFTSYRGS
jgi:5-hydroxyisourate hydrolase